MKWTKPSASTIDYFERIAPGPPIEARSMFGMPSRFLNGHMLVSVFGDSLMLHLSEADREECIAAGARPFAPHGRSAKEYVEIQIGHFEDQTLKEWIVRGMRYLGSLPPRLGDAKAQKPKAVKATAVKAMPVKAKPVKPKTKPAKAKRATPQKSKPAKAKPAAKRPAKKAARAKKAMPRRAAPAKKSSAKKSSAKKRR